MEKIKPHSEIKDSKSKDSETKVSDLAQSGKRSNVNGQAGTFGPSNSKPGQLNDLIVKEIMVECSSFLEKSSPKKAKASITSPAGSQPGTTIIKG